MANLKADGDNMPVTSADVPEYLELYDQWRLVDSMADVFTTVASQLALQIPKKSLMWPIGVRILNTKRHILHLAKSSSGSGMC
jgi:hypothetical protein